VVEIASLKGQEIEFHNQSTMVVEGEVAFYWKIFEEMVN
jgi:hypothetical protein